MSPMISVIIVNYNSGDRLSKCLEHLHAQSFSNFEVIIVDNASHDGSTQFLETTPQNIQLIKSDENLGFAAGNNLAVKQAKGVWLAFLNPDAYPTETWLNAFYEATLNYPKIEAFGSTQLNAHDPSLLDGAGDVYHILGIPYRGYFGWPTTHINKDCFVFAACAAAAFYKTERFRALKGFDERFFCYGEDVDLGFRHRLFGGECLQLEKAIVAHEGSAISGRHSTFTIYHGHRNRIWLAYKNTPFWLYWPLLPFHFLANLYLFFRFLLHGAAKPYCKAMIDGYFGLAQFKFERKKLQLGRKISISHLYKIIEISPLKLMKRQGRYW